MSKLKSNAREDFEMETKIIVEKMKRKEIISGIGHLETLTIYRSYFDENQIKHCIKEKYQLIDYTEAGADLIIRYRLSESKEVPK
jgi:hypothetical protein